jgi:hypothetical protein
MHRTSSAPAASSHPPCKLRHKDTCTGRALRQLRRHPAATGLGEAARRGVSNATLLQAQRPLTLLSILQLEQQSAAPWTWTHTHTHRHGGHRAQTCTTHLSLHRQQNMPKPQKTPPTLNIPPVPQYMQHIRTDVKPLPPQETHNPASSRTAQHVDNGHACTGRHTRRPGWRPQGCSLSPCRSGLHSHMPGQRAGRSGRSRMLLENPQPGAKHTSSGPHQQKCMAPLRVHLSTN